MVPTTTLVLGTGNRGKSEEFRRLLDGPWRLSDLAEIAGWDTVEEDGPTLAGNARRKARVLASQLKHWVLADDTGLEVDALEGEPGVHSARFAGPNATAEANRRLLLQRLSGVAASQRSASFVCQLALADPSGEIRAESTGRCRGRIRTTAAGAGGFGYDCLFEIVEYHVTLAELGEAASACLTHRARAIEAIRARLRELLARGM